MEAALGGECASQGTDCLIAAQEPGDTDNCCPCGSNFAGNCVSDGFEETLCESHVIVEQALAACICEECTEEGGGGFGQGGSGQGGFGQGGFGQGGFGQGGAGQGGAANEPCAGVCPGSLFPLDDVPGTCADCVVEAALGGDCAARGTGCLAATEEQGDTAGCCPCGAFIQGECADSGFLPEICESNAAALDDLATCACQTCG